jgi:hypothetical protein
MKNRETIYDVKKENGLAIGKLGGIMRKWQAKLLLNKWKLSLKIVEFRRKDFQQSGDIKVKPKNKEAVLLLTNKPFKDEEGVIVHELLHLLLWDYDTFAERVILKNCRKFKGDHSKYMNKLEGTVKNLTDIFVHENKKGG